MTLSPGTRLGSYEILASLGAGGMGEVYKAKDPKLARDVAIKVLPEDFLEGEERRERFEREAKLLAALNHPNIAAVYSFEDTGGSPILVMELLEGESLRARLAYGALPPRKATELAIQMAEGLGAAHERGVVHRDLKPENLWITKDGRLKILDFGLAKQVGARGSGSESNAPTAAPTPGLLTDRGMILGTLGYMSPEQVRGEAVDGRSDIFSFGVVLFEMLTARRAFARDTASDTLAAILRDDPPEIEGTGRPIPPGLHQIVNHCLEKRPEERFHSAHDLGFALQNLSSAEGSAAPITAPFAPQNRRTTWIWGALAAALVAGAGLAGWLLRGGPAPLPSFRPLTNERGTLSAARFVPNSPEIVYSAQWAGGASQWYARRLDQPGTRPLPGSEGILLSVSAAGEGVGLARPYLSHGVQVGSLFGLPLAGGAQREWVSSGVWGACQGSRPGELAAVIGEYSGEIRLEWPLGQVVFKALDVLRSPKIRGDLLAFFQEQGDNTEDGNLNLVDRIGKVRALTAVRGFTGLAWGPRGDEIWVSTYRDGESRLFAVSLSGGTRTLLRHAGRLELQDVDAAGRVLAAFHSYQRQTFGRARGETRDRDLGWLDAQATMGLTADGSAALLAPLGEWSRVDGTVYLRPLSGAPAQALGLGQRQSTISADGKWVMTCTNEPTFSVVAIPTGGGAPRRVPIPDFAGNDLRVDLLPDGRTAIIWGRRHREAFAFYALDLDSGNVRKISASGTSPFAYQSLLSPDGRWIAYVHAGGGKDGALPIEIARTDGTAVRAVFSLPRSEAVSGWGPDSSSLTVWDRNKVPAEMDRVDLATGKRTRILTVLPADPVGIPGIQGIQVTPDASAYTYNVTRKLSELYLVEGLK
ncbi:MAG: serine/threonine-protein kinase [Thermoanaerobaculia bacterium]|nr:serine/threonine-protein kinase [Thermoanaerobaculia bacterium]